MKEFIVHCYGQISDNKKNSNNYDTSTVTTLFKKTPQYVWHGFGSFDPEEEKCMAYKPQTTNPNDPLSGDVGYYWKRDTCTNKYPALCEIDLDAQGCQAFGFSDISSEKWLVSETEADIT